jgi:hypothetical protein
MWFFNEFAQLSSTILNDFHLIIVAGPIITGIIAPPAGGEEQGEDEKDGVEEVLAAGSEWTLESWLASKGTLLTVPQARAATALVPR